MEFNNKEFKDYADRFSISDRNIFDEIFLSLSWFKVTNGVDPVIVLVSSKVWKELKLKTDYFGKSLLPPMRNGNTNISGVRIFKCVGINGFLVY